jgi:hypothetical protein
MLRLIDLIRDWLSSLTISNDYCVYIEDNIPVVGYESNVYILLEGKVFVEHGIIPFKFHSIVKIYDDYVLRLAYEYDLNTLDTITPMSGREYKIYAADPEFFDKLKEGMVEYIKYWTGRKDIIT